MRASLKGVLFIILSAVLYGSYGVWSKIMGDSVGSFAQAWSRGLMILVLTIPTGIYYKQFRSVEKADLKWFFVIILASTFTVAPYYYAVNIIGVGVTTLLFYAALLIGGIIFGALFFGEKITRIKIVSFILGTIGLYLLFSFNLQPMAILPVLCAVGAGLAGSAEVVFTKKISKKYSSLQMIVGIYLAIAISHFPLSFFLHEKQLPLTISSPVFLAQLAFTLSALLALYLVILGYKYIEASVGTLLGLLEVVFGLVFGIILFHEVITIYTLLGAFSILVSAALPSIVDIYLQRRSKNEFRSANI